MTSFKMDKLNGPAIIAILILLPLMVTAASYGLSEWLAAGSVEAAQAPSVFDAGVPAYDGQWSSPAMAVSHDAPFLLWFTPHEMCQITYCAQPEMVAELVADQVGDAVEVIPVTVHAIPYFSEPLSGGYYLENWDLYPVTPYDSWLPALESTPFGLGLYGSAHTLVDGNGAIVSQGYGFPNLGSLLIVR